MAQLSREDFKRIFGVDPDVYQQMTGSTLVEAPKNTSRPRSSAERTLSSGGILDTAKMALDVATSALPAFGRSIKNDTDVTEEVAKDVTQGYNPSRALDNAAAGVLATPGAVGGAIDLVRKGVPAVVEGALSDDDKAITSRIADAFMQRIMPPEVQDALAD